jgi:hypothetical protein
MGKGEKGGGDFFYPGLKPRATKMTSLTGFFGKII